MTHSVLRMPERVSLLPNWAMLVSRMKSWSCPALAPSGPFLSAESLPRLLYPHVTKPRDMDGLSCVSTSSVLGFHDGTCEAHLLCTIVCLPVWYWRISVMDSRSVLTMPGKVLGPRGELKKTNKQTITKKKPNLVSY